MNYKNRIPIINDWPKKGVNFLDISAILEDPMFFNECTLFLIEKARNFEASSIIALESRGFLFSPCVALTLSIPLIILRKPNKLPGRIKTISYETEYSIDSLSVKENAPVGARPYIIDDLVATGGTILAAHNLLTNNFPLIKNIAVGTIINLDFLPGRQKLLDKRIKLDYLIDYHE